MNKQHWNSVKADGEVPDGILRDLLDKAYQIVLGVPVRRSKRRFWEMNELISCCGSDCSVFYCYGEMCKVCNAVCGKGFHTPEGKEYLILGCIPARSSHYVKDAAGTAIRTLVLDAEGWKCFPSGPL